MSKLTIDQAEAWEAGRDACEHLARDIAKRMHRIVQGEDGVSASMARQNAALADLIADAIARLEPPRALPDGLAGRGA